MLAQCVLKVCALIECLTDIIMGLISGIAICKQHIPLFHPHGFCWRHFLPQELALPLKDDM